MKLLTKAIESKMLKNGALPDKNKGDLYPVLKLFNPAGAATWLLTELNPEYPDIAFGLCDLGMGEPELGSVSLEEIQSVRLFGGALGIERDLYFKANKSISEYAKEARAKGRLIA